MRKQFETRVRLVIYMDARDLNRLTAHARREGRVLVAWAREVLLAAGVTDARRAPRPQGTEPHQIGSSSILAEAAESTGINPGLNASVSRKGSRFEPPATSIPETGVRHTASSNRLTCMCATCSAYRKAHDIPLGGAPKKEKK
jgi:hypothetical protein